MAENPGGEQETEDEHRPMCSDECIGNRAAGRCCSSLCHCERCVGTHNDVQEGGGGRGRGGGVVRGELKACGGEMGDEDTSVEGESSTW